MSIVRKLWFMKTHRWVVCMLATTLVGCSIGSRIVAPAPTARQGSTSNPATTAATGASTASNESLPRESLPASTVATAVAAPPRTLLPPSTIPDTNPKMIDNGNGKSVPNDSPDGFLNYDTFAPPGDVIESTEACSFPAELFPDTAQPVEMITWVKGNRVMGLANHSTTIVCLYQSDVPITSLTWSPNGERLLVGSTTVVSKEGSISTGFGADADVKWSFPKGTSLLGRLSDGTLRKHTFKSDTKQFSADSSVSFLDDHEAAIYHPGGKNIFAIGTGAEAGGNAKQVGVWFADNLGQKRKLAIRDIDALDISEPAFDGTGSSFFFIAKHKTHNHVHLYSTSTSKFSVAIDSPRPLSNLVVQQAAGSTAAVRVGSCEGTQPTTIAETFLVDNEQASFMYPGDFDHPEFADQWLTPVGFPMGSEMLFLARPAGCTGPASLYLEYEDETSDVHAGLTKKIIDNVEIVALRGVQSLPRELGAIVSAQVVT
jgi:hypothetical protein